MDDSRSGSGALNGSNSSTGEGTTSVQVRVEDRGVYSDLTGFQRDLLRIVFLLEKHKQATPIGAAIIEMIENEREDTVLEGVVYDRLSALQEQGLIEKRVSPTDQRSKCYAVTEDGGKVLKHYYEVITEQLSGISDEENTPNSTTDKTIPATQLQLENHDPHTDFTGFQRDLLRTVYLLEKHKLSTPNGKTIIKTIEELLKTQRGEAVVYDSLSELESKGVLEKRVSPTDQRKKCYVLTNNGKRMLKRHHGIITDHLTPIFES